MEDRFIEESVRQRLILSGITELEEHGLADFSLRRAAIGAQVSCAAPYRHFKDKDEFIREIVKYVNSKWELLSVEIEKIYENEPPRLAYEMCMAALRFRIANKNFRSVFTLTAELGSESILDAAVKRAVRKYCKSRDLSDDDAQLKEYTAAALISGSLLLSGKTDADRILSLFGRRLAVEFV